MYLNECKGQRGPRVMKVPPHLPDLNSKTLPVLHKITRVLLPYEVKYFRSIQIPSNNNSPLLYSLYIGYNR